MPEEYYKAALKQAQKEYRSAVGRKEPPYLPVLDSLLKPGHAAREQSLGIRQIPADFIAGTKNSGRANLFAKNFMPLAPEDSEFAEKWKTLCRAHLQEGIRDPVKAYEYLNRYYIEEGNKRVSVLKFFGAVEIPAQVYRILPERTDDPAVQRYYELLDFASYSRIQFLEFSRSGCYEQLQKVMGKEPKEPWTEDERSLFTSCYVNFQAAYELKGGKALPVTTGDAFLAYVKVYGMQELRYGQAKEIGVRLSRLWEEITLLQYPDTIDLKLEKDGEKKPPLLTQLVRGGETKLRQVAFVHDKRPEQSGWIYHHELGREHVERVFEGKLRTKAYYASEEVPPEQVIDQAIGEGCTVIFTTSPRLLPASLKAAVKYPQVTVLNCSLNVAHRYIRTYYARMYEVKYILGAVAGALAGSHNVGYICDYPIYGQIAGINAFALGVQLTNPKANVYLDWSGTGSVEEALSRLKKQGILLISSVDAAGLTDRESGVCGLSLVMEEEAISIARPVLQWGVYYEAIIRQILNKSFRLDYEGSGRALNYFWGMDAGVVSLEYNDGLLDGNMKLVSLLEKSICSGIWRPFHGALYDQEGRKRQGKHEDLTPEQITRMDWLVENVIGSIPSYEQLTKTGQETVAVAGVEQAARPSGEGRAEKLSGRVRPEEQAVSPSGRVQTGEGRL